MTYNGEPENQNFFGTQFLLHGSGLFQSIEESATLCWQRYDCDEHQRMRGEVIESNNFFLLLGIILMCNIFRLS